MLFSGQNNLGPLIYQAATWSVGALILLIVAKSLAYALSLSSFRGGPIFPAMFIGRRGRAWPASHLPGHVAGAGVAMGIGVMATVMLGLPFTSVLLATLLLGADGLTTMPLVIVGVAVAYVTSGAAAALDRPDHRPGGRRAPAPSRSAAG